jgi:Tol biopolymer transport system component
MNDDLDFEARLSNAVAAYADRAPVEVDAIAMTAALARGRPRRSWPLFNGRVSWLVVGTMLALLALGAALVIGAYEQRPRPAIDGGGLLLIDQAGLPQGGQRAVSEHVFTLDATTGDRRPIVDWVTKYPYGSMSAAWSPDRTHALLIDSSAAVRGIVDVTRHQLSPIQLQPGDVYDNFAERLAWAPGGDRVASQVANDTTNIQGSILISDLTGHELRRLPVPSGWIAGHPTWSRDGSSLILSGCRLPCADGANDENLLLIPLDGSLMRVLLEPGSSYGPAVWSPDGSIFAFESSIGIQTMDVATGRQTIVTRGNDRQPSWSPDGRTIAFARFDDQFANGAIYVVDVDGGNLRRVTTDTNTGMVTNPEWSPDGTMLTFGRYDGVMSTDLDVWIVGADGAAPHLLVRNAVSDW